MPVWLGSTGAQWVAAATHTLAAGALIALWLIQGHPPAAGLMALVSITAMAAAYCPAIPLPARFFPVSAIAGVAGAFVPMLGGLS